MKLTNEDFAAVAAYEDQIRTAIRSKYLRNVGRSGLAVLRPIYERTTGIKKYVNSHCGACVLDFLQRIGAIYFADKAEREAVARQSDKEEPAPAIPKRRRTKKS